MDLKEKLKNKSEELSDPTNPENSDVPMKLCSPSLSTRPAAGGSTTESAPAWKEKHPHLIPFNKMSPEKHKELSAAGGKAGKGITKTRYSKCIKCEVRRSCPRAFEETDNLREKYPDKEFDDANARCLYEIEGRQALKDGTILNHLAFVGSNPEDMLQKMEVLFRKLEGLVKKDPSYTKVANLLYMMQNMYKLKFGEKSFSVRVNKNINDGNPSMDIKAVMEELRKSQLSDLDNNAIDVTNDAKQEDKKDNQADHPPTPGDGR